MIELVALVISLGALGVSWAGMYLTSLSPAEIEVDWVRQGNELLPGGFSGPHPQDAELQLAVFLSNTGARGGLIEALSVEGLEWRGTGEPFWTRIWRSYPIHGPSRAAVGVPIALEAGDVETVVLVVNLLPAGGAIEDQARRLSGMDVLAMEIKWTFVRVKGLPVRWRLIPEGWRRRRERIDRSLTVEIDAKEYRRLTIETWRSSKFEHLVELAEAKPSPVAD